MPSLANLSTGYYLVSQILVYQFEHIKKNDRKCELWFLILSRVSSDQRCSETPQSVTKKMDIRGLQSAEDHCYLQYSPLYFASFEITNWIDNLFTTIFCSHIMSNNRSPLKTTNMAPTGGLFGSQQRSEDNVGAADNNAGNAPSKDTQFGQPPTQFIHNWGIVTCLGRHHFQVLLSSTTLPHWSWH